MLKVVKYVFILLAFSLIFATSIYWKNDIPIEVLKEKYAPNPSQFVSVMSMDVHFRDEGNISDSIPVVLIHGTGASLHTWEECIAGLKDSFRIITMDLPAYGLTGPNPDRNYSMAFYVEFLNEFLTHKGVNRCILGGNSLGGAIAWNYTHRYPDQVEKLILINSAGYPIVSESQPIAFTLAKIPLINKLLNNVTPRFLAQKSVENVYADPSKITDSLVDRYYELFLRPGNRQAFVDRMKFSEYGDYKNDIKSISTRTLILWGDKDRLIPVENAHKFQSDLANDTLVILDNIGHVPMEEDPQKTLQILRAFISK